MENEFSAALAEAKAARRSRFLFFLLFCLLFVVAASAVFAVKGIVTLAPVFDGEKVQTSLARLELGTGAFRVGHESFVLIAEQATVEAEYEGYIPVKRVAVAGEKLLSIVLVRRPLGIEISFAPGASKLYIDGQFVPIAEGVSQVELHPGEHDYRLFFANGAMERGVIKASHTATNIDLTMVSPARTLTISGDGISQLSVCGRSYAGQEQLHVPPDCGSVLVVQNGAEKLIQLEEFFEDTVLLDDFSLTTVRVSGLPGNASLAPPPLKREGDALTFAEKLPFQIEVTAPGYRKAEYHVNKPARFFDFGKNRILVPVEITSVSSVLVSSSSGNLGSTPLSLMLPYGNHRFVASAEGMASKEVLITIDSEQSQNVTVELEEMSAFLRRTEPDSYIPAGLSSPLIRVSGSNMTLGAGIGERGAKADEIRRQVSFSREFYVGAWEVSKKDYSAFDPKVKPSDEPVVGVSWSQAALYCNWLSERSGLAPFYVFKGGVVVAIDRASTGFRLPSEAEWEFVAGLYKRKFKTIFPWGNAYSIAAYSGNVADVQAKNLARKYIVDYDDGFPMLSPVQKGPELNGFRNLAGNAAEWVHDSYLIQPANREGAYLDYLGPGFYDQKVIKGSSYLTGEGAEMRVSARRASSSPVSDVGFRVARYVF